MRYREQQPSAPLAGIVESFWTLETSGDSVQRVVPDGHPELILNLGDPFEAWDRGAWQRQPRCFLAGQIRGPLLLRPNGRAHIVGVRFHPHTTPRLLPAPMHELAGQFTPIADVSAALARAIDSALDTKHAVASVERALLAHAPRAADALIEAAVARIVHHRGAIDLAALARDLGAGRRQFERRFNAAVGLAPKLFCRLLRFTKVFRAMGPQPGRWVDTALACGYYDQAHLIRDFKEFTGETPAALLAADADLARHFLERFGVSHSYNTAAAVSR